MRKRQGGAVEVIPFLIKWLEHKIVGHPDNKVESGGYLEYYCTECGTFGLSKPEGVK